MKSTKILAIVLTGVLTLLVFSTVYSTTLNDTVQDQTSTSDINPSSAVNIPYRGNLTDEAGNPVNEGIYAFKFSIFEDQNNNELLWSEEQKEVKVNNGVFTVQLGSVQTLPAKFLESDQLLLHIAVRGQGDDTFTALNPPQVLQPVSSSNPESVSAQAACAHDHLGEEWIFNSSTTSGLTIQNNDHYAVRGNSTNSTGVYGWSIDGKGVRGDSNNGTGVYGWSGSAHGVYGTTGGDWSYISGVYGEAFQDHANGVTGWNTAAGPGVFGHSETGDAGYFDGDVHVTGYLTKAGGGFKIDHPLNPENQYLNHSFVESPDMKNVYDGVVLLDTNGEAWVELPAYFETLNKDFRYQLTAIGAPAPGLYVAQEIEGNRFQISGGLPDLKVSWQVTGIRHDPYAEAHPIQVEEDKTEQERGKYLHPVELGQPAILGLDSPQNQRPANEEGQ